MNVNMEEVHGEYEYSGEHDGRQQQTKAEPCVPPVPSVRHPEINRTIKRMAAAAASAADVKALTSTQPLQRQPKHQFLTASNDRLDVQYEEFQRYMEKTGTLSKLVTTMETFLEKSTSEPEMSNPKDVFLSILSEGVKPRTELHAVKAEILKMEKKLDRILDENTNLRSLLKIPEPPSPEFDGDEEWDDIEDETLDIGHGHVATVEEDSKDTDAKVDRFGADELLKAYDEMVREEERKMQAGQPKDQEEELDTIDEHPAESLEVEVDESTEPKKADETTHEPQISGAHEEEFLGEDEFAVSVYLETLASEHVEEEPHDDKDSLVSESDVDRKYAKAKIVDRFSDFEAWDSDSDEDIISDETVHKPVNRMFDEQDTTDSECFTDDSDIDSVCQALIKEGKLDGVDSVEPSGSGSQENVDGSTAKSAGEEKNKETT